jgi:hypothetical protein
MLKYFNKEMINAQLIPGVAGQYVNGEWEPEFGPVTDIRIIAPQPISANDTVNLPDGEHVRDYVKTYTKQKVYPREEEEENADVLFARGKFYKAYQVDDRAVLGKFYRIIMRKQEFEIWDGSVIDSETGFLVIDSETGEIVTDG